MQTPTSTSTLPRVKTPTSTSTLPREDPQRSLTKQQVKSRLAEVIKELDALKRPTDTPDKMTCPITLARMRSPVVCSDGQTFERSAVERWLEENLTNPTTGKPLVHRHLNPSLALRNEIIEFEQATQRQRPPPSPTPRRIDPAGALQEAQIVKVQRATRSQVLAEIHAEMYPRIMDMEREAREEGRNEAFAQMRELDTDIQRAAREAGRNEAIAEMREQQRREAEERAERLRLVAEQREERHRLDAQEREERRRLEAQAEAEAYDTMRSFGERLYPLISAIEPELAGQIMSVLLQEDDNDVLYNLIESPEALNAAVREAASTLPRI